MEKSLIFSEYELLILSDQVRKKLHDLESLLTIYKNGGCFAFDQDDRDDTEAWLQANISELHALLSKLSD